MVPKEIIARARQMLEDSARPIFFHDDDLDGVSSFISCYQFCKEGKGVMIKQSPVLDEEYARKVDEYHPDLVVVLDKPRISEEFLARVKQPILWIDHHEPQEELAKRHGITYLNPRMWDDADNRPTAYWAYLITETNLWLSTVGCVADWHAPNFIDEFAQSNPGIVPLHYETVEELYLSERLGRLIRILQFNLKGKRQDVRRSILTLTRIEDPKEILEQTSARGRFIYKRYERFARVYDVLLEQAVKAADQSGRLFVFLYENDRNSVTSDLSNEILIRYPEKVTIIGRKHDGKVKASVRSKDVSLPEKIEESLEGLEGYGGGHANACGLVVKLEDWAVFQERFEKLL